MEKWIEIRPGVEVSSEGRVRKYIDGHLNGDGYLCISNGVRGSGKTPIHILVAEAFLGKRPEGLVIRHLNDDPTDNRLENLKYGTRSENALDAIRNGKLDYTVAERKAHLQRIAHLGGKWWKGKKRQGKQGPAIKEES
jgi:hypothetical protein